MPDYILGLPSSQTLTDRFENYRRNILSFYPNGGAPLTGLLSLIDEEELPDINNHWYEDRYEYPKTTARGTAPVTSTAPSTTSADDGTAVAGTFTGKTTSDAMYIKVADTKHIREGNVLQTKAGAYMVVDTISRSATVNNGYAKVYLLRTTTVAVPVAGEVVRVTGQLVGEGSKQNEISALPFRKPVEITNQCEIVRTPFQFTGSVLQLGQKWDKSGAYLKRAKQAEIEHMTLLERSILFGRRSTLTRNSYNGTGETRVVRSQSGILEFMEAWDSGNTQLTYAVDGGTANLPMYSVHDAATLDTDDDKRIITNAAGTISVRKWNEYAERVTRTASNKSRDKLVLCGSGALLAFTDMFQKNSEFHVKVDDSAYGLDFTTLTTPFGKFHFMTHPMFNMDSEQRYWAFILDVNSIKYRPLRNRDTTLLKNQQNNGDDLRIDAYRTEFSVEVWQPESNLLLKNVQTYTL